MQLKLSDNTFIRCINGYAYLINQKTRKEKIFEESAFVFLSEITRDKQDSKLILTKILKKFPSKDHSEIIQDFHDFTQELINDQFVLSSEVYDNNNGFQNLINNEINNNEVTETSEFLNNILKEKPFLFSIQIELLAGCNESCIHCYIPKPTRNLENHISFVEITNILDQAKESGVLSVSFTGGEPFLHKDFLSILKKARENDFIITILSNLTIISQEDISILKTLNIYNIQVSLYSINPVVHDSITGLKNSHKKTTENIERLLKAGIPIEVSCPIIKENQDCYVAVLEWCNQRGIKVYTDFNISAMTDFTKSNLAHRLSYNDLENTLTDILINDKNYNIFSVRNKQTILKNQPVKFSAFKSIAVSSEGKYVPDIGWNDFVLGDIKNDFLCDVWNNSEKLKLLRSIKYEIFPQCIECDASGYCTLCLSWNYYENGGDIFNIPSNYCEMIFLIKEIVEKHKKL